VRLGLTPWNFADLSAASLTDQAAFAQAHGYDSFWLPENHFNPRAIPDPLMLLAGVAAGTTTIRLGTTSYLLPLRHPLLAAEQVAVLDQLSHGRVLLGIGRGYSHPVLQAFDVDPASKRVQFETVLETMIAAWSGHAVAGDDEHPLVLDPVPVQIPHPPLWVAAFGPKALAQAGRLGLPYLASPIETLAELRANFERHRAAVAAAGHTPPARRPIMRTIFVSERTALITALRERLGRAKTATGGKPHAGVDDWAIIGDSQFVSDKFAEYREALAPTDMIVTRLRLDDLDERDLRASVARLAELFG